MSNLHFLKVKVVRIDEDRHKFIVEHEGKIYQVSQLAFQRQQPKPDFIDCIYYQTDNGGIYMSQDMQERLMKEAQDICKANPVGLSEEQMEAYTTIGGTPHLDGQYTVFGEVTEGLDVVEKIQSVKTQRGDRPCEDIKILKTDVL